MPISKAAFYELEDRYWEIFVDELWVEIKKQALSPDNKREDTELSGLAGLVILRLRDEMESEKGF